MIYAHTHTHTHTHTHRNVSLRFVYSFINDLFQDAVSNSSDCIAFNLAKMLQLNSIMTKIPLLCINTKAFPSVRFNKANLNRLY
jgi:hypothetical protein